ncbi:response regulator transcription factor [Streptomyces sp. NPDC086549]|uniref:response regulator transcription factor n=1 Tax=Streptomyces sp. NPDC086549 TaxID=3365752 RepID=UPI00380EB729
MEERHATLHVLPPVAGSGERGAQALPGVGRERQVRVHVVGADPLVRIGIRTLLTGHPGIHVTGESTPGPRVAVALRTQCPHVLVVHGPLTCEQQAFLADRAGDEVKVIVLGGAEPADAPAVAHGQLPGTATAGQLASAVILAAAGYAFGPAAGRSAHPAPRVSRIGPDELTRRECQVLELLARGLSNGEIAESLALSPHTVKTHVQNMLHKLRLPNRLHAAIYAFETGLRRPPC